MSHNDKEFVDYFPKMLQIAYELMMKLYQQFKPEGEPDLKPEWKVESKRLAIEYESIFSKMVDDLFGDAAKLDNDRFRTLMEYNFFTYLQAHELRNKVSLVLSVKK